MKPIWKLPTNALQRAELLILHRSTSYAKHKTLNHFLYPRYRSLIRQFSAEAEIVSLWPSNLGRIISLLDKASCHEANVEAHEELIQKVLVLKDELLQCNGVREKVVDILEDKGKPLFSYYRGGQALIELMEQLISLPQLALEVLIWRRNQANFEIPMTAEEYSKAITVAGLAKNVDFAHELFTEAAKNRIKKTSTYNSLIGAYMFNGLSWKGLSLFQKLKKDKYCTPNIVTYNILISVFGRLMLVDHMEATFKEINNLRLSPNLSTYNNLIAGYVTAWMWDRMEKTYMMMKENAVDPDVDTHLLMLRGYCHSGNLEKMEMMYELIKYHVCEAGIPLIRSMICTYCKSSDPNRVKKTEELLKFIPESGYRPWINVWLIELYAQEDMLEKMEKYVNEAFERHILVKTARVMRMIITAYFRRNAVDKLAQFVKRAEHAGWRICRSIYHCKMIIYGSQNRLVEMENVLTEMEKFDLNVTKKTFVILYSVYSQWGSRSKLEQVAGLMCKLGYGIPYGMPLKARPSSHSFS